MDRQEINKKILQELVKLPDNNHCADCGAPGECVWKIIDNQLIVELLQSNNQQLLYVCISICIRMRVNLNMKLNKLF